MVMYWILFEDKFTQNCVPFILNRFGSQNESTFMAWPLTSEATISAQYLLAPAPIIRLVKLTESFNEKTCPADWRPVLMKIWSVNGPINGLPSSDQGINPVHDRETLHFSSSGQIEVTNSLFSLIASSDRWQCWACCRFSVISSRSPPQIKSPYQKRVSEYIATLVYEGNTWRSQLRVQMRCFRLWAIFVRCLG